MVSLHPSLAAPIGIFLTAALLALPAPASAGRNSGGALIVHTDSATSYTAGETYCDEPGSEPATCGDARTRVDAAPGTAAILWVLAAFPDGASPAVTVVQFGLDHTMFDAAILAHGPCPTDSIVIPSGGFPASGSGVSVGFLPIFDSLFPFYWFAIEGASGDRFGTARDPETQRAVFVDDSAVYQEDEITRFGHAAWGSEGSNDCPPALQVRDAGWGEIKDSYR